MKFVRADAKIWRAVDAARRSHGCRGITRLPWWSWALAWGLPLAPWSLCADWTGLRDFFQPAQAEPVLVRRWREGADEAVVEVFAFNGRFSFVLHASCVGADGVRRGVDSGRWISPSSPPCETPFDALAEAADRLRAMYGAQSRCGRWAASLRQRTLFDA